MHPILCLSMVRHKNMVFAVLLKNDMEVLFMNKKKNMYCQIMTRWKRTAMSSFLVLGLLGNILTVHAEEEIENDTSDSVETVTIDDIDTGLQDETKDIMEPD